MPNTNFQTFHQMGLAINEVVRQATGRDAVQNIDMDHVTVAQLPGFEVFAILVEPTDCKVAIGENASFTVKAIAVASYQWQYTYDNGNSWHDLGTGSGIKTATYSIACSEIRYTYRYRCLLTGKDGTTKTTVPVKMVRPSFAINQQPSDSVARVGERATFTVVAQGVESYQWEARFPNADWFNSTSAGNNTASVSFTVTEKNKTLQLRCKLTDTQGEVHYTNIVSIIWN